jgi:hypothetical protein
VGGDRTEAVAVPEQEDVAAELAQLVNHAVDPLGHLLRGLANEAPISEQLPPRMDLLDLLSGQPFELAVVVLEQPLVHPDPVAEPGEPAGLPGSEHRAREDVVEAAAGEELADRDGLQPPIGVSAMSVLPVCCPEIDHSVSPCRTSQIAIGPEA